jgi:hypothetical protein
MAQLCRLLESSVNEMDEIEIHKHYILGIGGWDREHPRQSAGDRPGIGAPGHLFKITQVAMYYNVLCYITMSSHKG